MSYDLNFWRYRDESAVRTDADHLAIYERLCEDETTEFPELEDLPVAAIRQRIANVLGEWTFEGDYHEGAEAFWSRGAGADASIIEAFFVPKWVRFDLRGRWTEEDANRLIDVLSGFGCPLFDPQEGEQGRRYALP